MINAQSAKGIVIVFVLEISWSNPFNFDSQLLVCVFFVKGWLGWLHPLEDFGGCQFTVSSGNFSLSELVEELLIFQVQ